jgi:hypothetical protein
MKKGSLIPGRGKRSLAKKLVLISVTTRNEGGETKRKQRFFKIKSSVANQTEARFDLPSQLLPVLLQSEKI